MSGTASVRSSVPWASKDTSLESRIGGDVVTLERRCSLELVDGGPERGIGVVGRGTMRYPSVRLVDDPALGAPRLAATCRSGLPGQQHRLTLAALGEMPALVERVPIPAPAQGAGSGPLGGVPRSGFPLRPLGRSAKP